MAELPSEGPRHTWGFRAVFLLQELHVHGVRDRGGRSCAARPATAAALGPVLPNPLPLPCSTSQILSSSEGAKKHLLSEGRAAPGRAIAAVPPLASNASHPPA